MAAASRPGRPEATLCAASPHPIHAHLATLLLVHSVCTCALHHGLGREPPARFGVGGRSSPSVWCASEELPPLGGTGRAARAPAGDVNGELLGDAAALVGREGDPREARCEEDPFGEAFEDCDIGGGGGGG
eukprot:CAMPEP_0181239638 /NCGR_PEP_ID=MMETSP1096-20121128/40057_1 /TAXON_ID=156174 ORGANISM="Chrysochromulina ericina, Strain CCMP281" /NCGR_SAMPLE_ID=MMETSP1096 /ASSEMBLY_ACC=CAM_ASM_000453 /LENGTH=130 /DNA_ID=CAMNT_0023335381 /DNA_START=73 /DNA_END=462 /DNA_ORIENTATION=+